MSAVRCSGAFVGGKLQQGSSTNEVSGFTGIMLHCSEDYSVGSSMPGKAKSQRRLLPGRAGEAEG